MASHPEIHGGGELYDLQRVIEAEFGTVGSAEFTDKFSQTELGRFSVSGDKYISATRKISDAATFVTDKMPDNFQLIGMIKLILPNAKIIHCRRDPLDTCLSIFKNLFTSDGHYYAYEQNELGRYFSLYRGLMDHWREALPEFIFDIQYEDVIADQETQTRAMLEYCGVEWDDACLEFHKASRPVYTASAVQVRRPIHRNSIQSWKNYEKFLSALREQL